MKPTGLNPIVHLELHTGNLLQAREFYAELCGWQTELVHTSSGTYRAFDRTSGVSAGLVECPTPRPLWLPYIEVAAIAATTARAGELGASVLLPPREGPAGWRSVVVAPAGGEVAFWQPKR
jgi:predicted enzyme related to lactoylglutathione lyase